MNRSASNKSLYTVILLALTSSLCCIGPVLDILGGIGGAASSFSWAATLRPYIIGVTAVVLGYSFYLAYKPQPKTDACCDACEPEKKSFMRSKSFLWIITIVSALLISFPYYASAFYPAQNPSTTNIQSENLQSVTFSVEGMGCKDCENHINNSAYKQAGVNDSKTSYEKSEAIITFDKTKNTAEQIAISIEKETGYKVVPQIKKP